MNKLRKTTRKRLVDAVCRCYCDI